MHELPARMSEAPDLSFFSLLAHQPSLAAAAQALGVTPPAVSRRLAALEQRLGVRLLNRTTRRVSAGEDGSTYYRRCVAVLGEIGCRGSVFHERGLAQACNDLHLARMGLGAAPDAGALPRLHLRLTLLSKL
jgi:DNA-binding transcriptional ArsR family regulator